MADVIDLYRVCEGEPCQKPKRRITSRDDFYEANGRQYHKGCEPTESGNPSSNPQFLNCFFHLLLLVLLHRDNIVLSEQRSWCRLAFVSFLRLAG